MKCFIDLVFLDHLFLLGLLADLNDSIDCSPAADIPLFLRLGINPALLRSILHPDREMTVSLCQTMVRCMCGLGR